MNRIGKRCCNARCWAEDTYADQPCWGDVEVIDEETDGDDWWWIHACEGHENGYGGPYVPDPDSPKG